MNNKWVNDILNILKNGISEEHIIFARLYARKAKHHIDHTIKGLDNEALEIRVMARSFFRMLEHELRLNDRTDPPTKEEVRVAIEQLKDYRTVFIVCHWRYPARRRFLSGWS